MKNIIIVLMVAFLILFILSSFAKPIKEEEGLVNVSWYGIPHHGKKTASGKIFNMNELTAAHKRLPFGTKVRFINPKNEKEVIVTITDRGPYKGNREFDLSRAAFKELSPITYGLIKVKYEILK